MTKILVLGQIHRDGIEQMRREVAADVVELPDHAPKLMDEVADCDAIVVRMTRIDEPVIAAAPRLRVVARHGVGYDTVDVAALTRHGIPLALVGDVNSTAVAEHTLALMLALAKRIVTYDRELRAGNFAVRDGFSATELADKTALLLGFGRIGQATARLCAAFGMRVLIYDPFVAAESLAASPHQHVTEFVPYLGAADYVSIHVPRLPETRHLIGAPELAAMKPTAALLNVSRGGIVDEVALADALAGQRIGGAGLDVFETEPPAADSALLRSDRVVVTPHSAAFTGECARRMALACAGNVAAALAGHLDPAVVVNRETLGAAAE